ASTGFVASTGFASSCFTASYFESSASASVGFVALRFGALGVIFGLLSKEQGLFLPKHSPHLSTHLLYSFMLALRCLGLSHLYFLSMWIQYSHLGSLASPFSLTNSLLEVARIELDLVDIVVC